MFELTIGLPRENCEYLEIIKDNLLKLKIRIYMVSTFVFDRAELSIATSEENKAKIVKNINKSIIDIIIYIYKENYFIQHLNTQKLNELLKNALLKALVLFDVDTDREIIKDKLKYNKRINLDSFYHFQLNSLKLKWKEIINLANENSCYFFECDTFLDLLKFLISAIEPKNEEVSVYYNGSDFTLLDEHQKKINNKLVNSTNDKELDLITTLITLAPTQINLHCINSMSNKTFKVLYYIFDKKVNLLV